jgi:hypothetical protein
MPTPHEFNGPAQAQLVRWINGEIHALNETAMWFPFHRSRVKDAVDRLNRCKQKLRDEDLSNKPLQVTPQ